MSDALDEIDLILDEIMETSLDPSKKNPYNWRGRPMPREVQEEYYSLLD